MVFKRLIRAIKQIYVVRFLLETIRRFNEDQGAVLAGYIAYAAMLSLFPFLIFAISLAGVLIGDAESQKAAALLFEAVPEHVAKTLQPVLQEVLGNERRGIVTISAIGTIYAASNGVQAVRIGLDRAYDIDTPRNFVLNRLVSIGIVILGFFVFGALALLIIFAPLAFQITEAITGYQIPLVADLVRYVIGAALLFSSLWLMHRTLPARPMGWKKLWPGVVVSLVMWGLLATAMSIYVANTPTYTLTYGALAGVAVTLLFFYLTGVSIIFGAEVNATLNFGLPPLEEE